MRARVTLAVLAGALWVLLCVVAIYIVLDLPTWFGELMKDGG